MSYAIFGGTFNPIHYGHLRAAAEAADILGLDEVVFVPSGLHPFKGSDAVDVSLRIEMARIAIEGNPKFSVSDIEANRAGISYTVDTIKQFRASRGNGEALFMLGADAFMELPLWRDYSGIIAGVSGFAILCRPPEGFEALKRSSLISSALPIEGVPPGGAVKVVVSDQKGAEAPATLVGVSMLDISSTFIRASIRAGGSARYLLPERVESFIMSNELYID